MPYAKKVHLKFSFFEGKTLYYNNKFTIVFKKFN